MHGKNIRVTINFTVDVSDNLEEMQQHHDDVDILRWAQKGEIDNQRRNVAALIERFCRDEYKSR